MGDYSIVDQSLYYSLSLKQETAEDGKAILSQFDLENRQYQGHGYHRNQ